MATILRLTTGQVYLVGFSGTISGGSIILTGTATATQFISSLASNVAGNSAASPAFSWSAAPASGMFLRGPTSEIGFSAGGTNALDINGTSGVLVLRDAYIGWGGVSDASSTPVVTLYRDGADDTLALRRSTNAQLLNIYNTYTDATHYERLEIGDSPLQGANNFSIVANQGSGGGASRNILMGTNGAGEVVLFTGGSTSQGWKVTGAAGNLVATIDNSKDIGALGATRPRTGYFGTSIITPTVNATTGYQVNGSTLGTATIGPSSPTGTTSTTLVMAGLGGSITTRTGRIVLSMSGVCADGVANDGVKMQMSYGTSTAPVNGAALTGTQVGPIQQFNAANVASETCPYGSQTVITGLTPGTTYWFDTAFAAITGGTATLTQAFMMAHDIV